MPTPGVGWTDLPPELWRQENSGATTASDRQSLLHEGHELIGWDGSNLLAHHVSGKLIPHIASAMRSSETTRPADTASTSNNGCNRPVNRIVLPSIVTSSGPSRRTSNPTRQDCHMCLWCGFSPSPSARDTD